MIVNNPFNISTEQPVSNIYDSVDNFDNTDDGSGNLKRARQDTDNDDNPQPTTAPLPSTPPHSLSRSLPPITASPNCVRRGISTRAVTFYTLTRELAAQQLHNNIFESLRLAIKGSDLGIVKIRVKEELDQNLLSLKDRQALFYFAMEIFSDKKKLVTNFEIIQELLPLIYAYPLLKQASEIAKGKDIPQILELLNRHLEIEKNIMAMKNHKKPRDEKQLKKPLPRFTFEELTPHLTRSSTQRIEFFQNSGEIHNQVQPTSSGPNDLKTI
ncbi:MAG: hypothetical protein A2X78_00840 [Gammaproteobacteria bacterium GWE2_37_16]|nr:MAG: hypothetical protein A2X78_00840 [Gammaproteobacteria bacterium GWE2_37_16]